MDIQLIENKTMSAITINNQSITIDQSLRAKSGGIIKISEFAAMKGLAINKETRKQFDLAKREFYTNNRKALALAAADHTLDVTKVKFVHSARTGEFTGLDMSCRFAPEAAPAADENAILKTAAAKLAKQIGVTEEVAFKMLTAATE
jgi:hypothetical protein